MGVCEYTGCIDLQRRMNGIRAQSLNWSLLSSIDPSFICVAGFECLPAFARIPWQVIFQAAIFELLEQEIQLAFSFCNVLKPEIGVWPRQAIKGLMMMRIAQSDLTHSTLSLTAARTSFAGSFNRSHVGSSEI